MPIRHRSPAMRWTTCPTSSREWTGCSRSRRWSRQAGCWANIPPRSQRYRRQEPAGVDRQPDRHGRASPIGCAVTLTGNSGLDGYCKGLVGALARAGVDVSDRSTPLDPDKMHQRSRRRQVRASCPALLLCFSVRVSQTHGPDEPAVRPFCGTVASADASRSCHPIVARRSVDARPIAC